MRTVRDAFQLSERRACHAVGVWRSGVRYRSRRPSQLPLRQRIREIAAVRLSYGYKRVHVLLQREGWPVNRKRVHRLYREEQLQLRRKRPTRRRSAVAREGRAAATAPNQRWAMDFVHDQLGDGRAFRVFAAVDVFTRECVALVARPRFRGADVAAVLTAVGAQRPLPAVIQCDNGTEFTSIALDHWAYARGVRLDFSRRGTPTDNAVAESFNASLRRECLSQALFSTPTEVEQDLRAWQHDYNNVRPDTSLGNRSPAHFRAHHSPEAAAATPRKREA